MEFEEDGNPKEKYQKLFFGNLILEEYQPENFICCTLEVLIRSDYIKSGFYVM